MTPLESKLRTLFDVPASSISPEKRIQHLGAFWPHWTLHKRKCDVTHRDIISVFRPECPYPVWHKDEWFKNARPPQAQFDFSQGLFPQAEKLFKQCPIYHHSGLGSENCEYTEDWWYGKNCYLCHSGCYNEDSRNSYRIMSSKNVLYGVFSQQCENSIDVINCDTCYSIVYGLYLRNCRNCSFSYDCRNCSDCMFCFNLRNKQYCLGNKQLTKEEYENQKKQFDYSTIIGYQRCCQIFQKMIREIAWHKNDYLDFAENSTGNYIFRVKDVSNTFFGGDGESSHNISRFGWIKTALDSINLQDCEEVILSSGIQIKCYNIGFSYQLENSRFCLYSGYSAQIENCFGCCGLVRGKNCILNKPYSVQEYDTLRNKIVDHMKSTGEWGCFFPGSFAPNPYDESWSSFYFPLNESAQKERGYFYLPNPEKHNTSFLSVNQLPLTAQEATEFTTRQTYWDEVVQKPFQILPQDINLCRELGVVLPHTHYMRRIQENFKWMPYSGVLRTTQCAQSGAEIMTSWPREYDGRILSEPEYLKIVA